MNNDSYDEMIELAYTEEELSPSTLLFLNRLSEIFESEEI